MDGAMESRHSMQRWIRALGKTMPSPWTPSRDKRLLALQAKGRSAAEIAKTLGTTRNAVIGRSIRLRGIVYQSSIDSWKRANAKRKTGPRKPEKMRRKAMREMAKALARGVPKEEAMSRASAGALWREIGEYFGMSRQAAQYAAKTWERRKTSGRRSRR